MRECGVGPHPMQEIAVKQTPHNPLVNVFEKTANVVETTAATSASASVEKVENAALQGGVRTVCSGALCGQPHYPCTRPKVVPKEG